MATPDDAGEPVHDGHRFALHDEPDDAWLRWQPSIAIGGLGLGDGMAPPPGPTSARLTWKEGSWIKSKRALRGWVLPIAEGLLGPADLFRPPDDANPGTVRLEVEGRVFPIVGEPIGRGDGVAVLATDEFSGDVVLPEAPPATPIDCLAFRDRPGAPLPLVSTRLAVEESGGGWRVDPAMTIDPAWHGAPVVERATGRLVGVLQRDRDGARIAFIAATP